MQRSNKSKKQVPIAVYIRQRPRNKQEIEDCVPCVLEIPNCKEIYVRHSTISEKQYHFDKVFGPEEAQTDVYYTVLHPLIAEVLEGYNCTVFAYGQTGTGKTYTIMGNLEGNPSVHDENPDSGLITRAAVNIFSNLSKPSVKEFTVRVSFIELYNEELKDLLRDNDTVPLRLYEDPRQKGSVVVQNIIEKTVCSAEEVHEILLKGMEKRQTAATLLNDQSSRSHCVFTINVYMKEILVNGVETVKTGKLNLVDLAGSENINRSGAVNTRAREAGNINQSLLTLGRVIKALVENQQHIPYRDSKLTRLLQDSLGGKTKTAIIATISPSLSCLDETISTLEYAYRACYIVNCPEANKASSKSQIVDMLTKQMECLQKDIAALRKGAGFYVNADNYRELLTEMEKNENLILSRNELILRLEHQIQHISKTLEIEEQRWRELMESFEFTKVKGEQYRQKDLKTKAQIEMLRSLVDLYSKRGRTISEKNQNMQAYLATSINAINAYSLKLNTFYNKSKHYDVASESLTESLHKTADNIHDIIRKFESDIADKKRKMEENLREITDIIGGGIEKSQKHVATLSKYDLPTKMNAIENVFTNEQSNCAMFRGRLDSAVLETNHSISVFANDVAENVQIGVKQFGEQLKSDSVRRIGVYEEFCDKSKAIKGQLYRKADAVEPNEFFEKFTGTFTQMNDAVSSKLCLIIKRKQMLKELKEQIERLEKYEENKYVVLRSVLDETEVTANVTGITKQNVNKTSKVASEKLENLNPDAHLQTATSYIQHADAVKNSIAEKYVEDVKKLQCRSKSDLQAICNSASTGTKQIIDRYVECSQQNCSLAKDSLENLKVLFHNNHKNWANKLAIIDTNAREADKLFANMQHEKLAKQIQTELTSMDKENACLYQFKNDLVKIEPSGDTPKKPNYNYPKQLVHYRTPIAAKCDNNLHDISVQSLNISAIAPEDIETNIEGLLQEEGISVNESLLDVVELETSISSTRLSEG